VLEHIIITAPTATREGVEDIIITAPTTAGKVVQSLFFAGEKEAEDITLSFANFR